MDTLRSEHLGERGRPIIASLVYRDFESNELEVPDMQAWIDNFCNDALNVDYYGSEEYLNQHGILHGGPGSFYFSPCDTRNKFSQRYHKCSGLVMSGIDKETGEEISIMSHQNPGNFLANPLLFRGCLIAKLREMKERAVEETIDVVVFGGKSLCTRWGDLYGEYIAMIDLLDEVVSRELGFTPVVLSGPKTELSREGAEAYYETASRRMLLVKPDTGFDRGEQHSFCSCDVEREVARWRGDVLEEVSGLMAV